MDDVLHNEAVQLALVGLLLAAIKVAHSWLVRLEADHVVSRASFWHAGEDDENQSLARNSSHRIIAKSPRARRALTKAGEEKAIAAALDRAKRKASK
jgi:hypothetical protein